MTCVHWWKGGDTRFEAGVFITDFVCKHCGQESTTRAAYVPWNAGAPKPEIVQHPHLRTLAEERAR